ncbi:hypothetical protein KP509_13G089000 [Ceratopteris richardii]|uniref:CCHC-type domain-containing protein n=1 Tax=Ceratopteris richardii TaxID=49495 RepID=A0A8T2THU1_CERRI|nr:hypothetical protein KP509_13G089000 [Ceratopteris richardii]
MRSYQLDKLINSNYLTWDMRVKLLLKRASLGDIVSSTPLELVAEELLMHLGDRQVQPICQCSIPAEIWTVLHSTYHHDDLITRVTTLKKLLSSSLANNQPSLVVGLTVASLVSRIHQEDTLRSAISSSQSTTISNTTFNMRRQLNMYSQNNPRPFHDTHRQSARCNPGHNTNSTCDYCGWQGHIECECRTKKRETQKSHKSSRAHPTIADDTPALELFTMAIQH